MNIGIIIYSHTGNTLSVAQKLKEKLEGAGNSVELEQVTSFDKNPTVAKKVELIKLERVPNTSKYDVLFFGAPVWAFSLSTVMKAYLSKIPSLQGKRVGLFVTQSFPYPWMGGNRAIRQMKEVCLSKGADVFETGVVNWSTKKRGVIISGVLERLSRL